MAVLALIPARGGSKGVPRKNIRALAGKPLLDYTIEAARAARLVDAVVVTTDDEEIAAVARAGGASVPFLRPAALAEDTTPTLPVVQHALEELSRSGQDFDAVCLLQPTNPFRPASLIDECIATFLESGADSVVTVLPVPAEHNPHWVYFRDGDGALRLSTGEAEPIPRRQELPPAFHREGSVYVTAAQTVRDGSLYGHRVVGVEVDPASSVNIDTLADWARAETLVATARSGAGR